MKRTVCWCGWSMPETCARAIEAHRKEHPTQEQIDDARNQRVLEMAVDAMDNRKTLNAVERMAVLDAVLNAKPGVIFDELFSKPMKNQKERC